MNKLLSIIFVFFLSTGISLAQKPMIEVGPEIKNSTSQFEFRFLKTNENKFYTVQRTIGYAGGNKFSFNEIFEVYDCQNLKNLLSVPVGKKGIESETMKAEYLMVTSDHATLFYSYYDKAAKAKKLVADVYDKNEKLLRESVELMSDPERDDKWKSSYFVVENEKTNTIAVTFMKKKENNSNPMDNVTFNPAIKIKTFTKELVMINEAKTDVKKAFIPLSFYFTDNGSLLIHGVSESFNGLTTGAHKYFIQKISTGKNQDEQQFDFGSSVQGSFDSQSLTQGRFFEKNGAPYFISIVNDKASGSGKSIYTAEINTSNSLSVKETLYPVPLNTALFKNKKANEKALEDMKIERVEINAGNIVLTGEQGFSYQREKNLPYGQMGNIIELQLNTETGVAHSNFIFHKGYITSQDYVQGVFRIRHANTTYFFFNDSPKNKTLIADDLKECTYEYYKKDMVSFYTAADEKSDVKKFIIDKTNIKNNTHAIGLLPSLTTKINDTSWMALVFYLDEPGYKKHFAKLTFE